jgi:hypothetical protein
MSYIIVDSKNGSDEMREKMREKMMQHGFRRMGGNSGAGDYRMGNYKDDKYEEGYCEGYKHGFEDAQEQMSQDSESGTRMGSSHSRYGR